MLCTFVPSVAAFAPPDPFKNGETLWNFPPQLPAPAAAQNASVTEAAKPAARIMRPKAALFLPVNAPIKKQSARNNEPKSTVGDFTKTADAKSDRSTAMLTGRFF